MNGPNILLIMTDQQRWDSLGCYGNRGAATPNLDRLAAEGVRFTRTYCNATICTPSRASIMTGRPVPGHGVYKLHDILPQDQVLFTEGLQRLGYTTALFGKLHVSGRVTEAGERHVHDGFDIYEWCLDPTIHVDSSFNGYVRWLGDEQPDVLDAIHKDGRHTKHFPARGHFSHWAAERTIDFLQTHGKEGPFFCKMSLFDPHDPYDDYPPEAAESVQTDQLPPVVSSTEAGEPVPEGIRREKEKSFYKGGEGPSAEDLEALRLGYHASISFLDQEIGRVLLVLEEEGLAESTMVLFASDHGDMMGDHELITKGAYFYDACTRVPLMVRFPGVIPAGTVSDVLVQPHDIAATALGLAGAPPEALQATMPHSQDLLQVIRDPGRGRDFAVTYYRNSGYGPGGGYFDPPINATMIRDNRHKLSLFHNPDLSDSAAQGELYDMEADPQELNNLWADPKHSATRLSLIHRLFDWTTSVDACYNGTRGGEAVTSQAN